MVTSQLFIKFFILFFFGYLKHIDLANKLYPRHLNLVVNQIQSNAGLTCFPDPSDVGLT
jgi:hypothetical protein